MITQENMRRIEKRILKVHDNMTKAQIERIIKENNQRTIIRLKNYCYEANNNVQDHPAIISGEQGDYLFVRGKRFI